MAYEFQRLDAVTEVEEVADDATVLIEEDGAIKRAPKSAIGGGGYDAVLQIVFGEPGEAFGGEATLTMLKGSYDDIYQKLETNDTPVSIVLVCSDGNEPEPGGEVIKIVRCNLTGDPNYIVLVDGESSYYAWISDTEIGYDD